MDLWLRYFGVCSRCRELLGQALFFSLSGFSLAGSLRDSIPYVPDGLHPKKARVCLGAHIRRLCPALRLLGFALFLRFLFGRSFSEQAAADSKDAIAKVRVVTRKRPREGQKHWSNAHLMLSLPALIAAAKSFDMPIESFNGCPPRASDRRSRHCLKQVKSGFSSPSFA